MQSFNPQDKTMKTSMQSWKNEVDLTKRQLLATKLMEYLQETYPKHNPLALLTAHNNRLCNNDLISFKKDLNTPHAPVAKTSRVAGGGEGIFGHMAKAPGTEIAMAE